MNKKVIIESKIKSGSIDSLMSFLKENLPNVRDFSGCQNVTIYFDPNNQQMIFDEEWVSVEHHQKYISAISASGVLSELATFLEAPPDIKYFDRIEL